MPLEHAPRPFIPSSMVRRRTQVSILFDSPCLSAEEAEDKLICMFAQAEQPEIVS